MRSERPVSAVLIGNVGSASGRPGPYAGATVPIGWLADPLQSLVTGSFAAHRTQTARGTFVSRTLAYQ